MFRSTLIAACFLTHSGVSFSPSLYFPRVAQLRASPSVTMPGFSKDNSTSGMSFSAESFDPASAMLLKASVRDRLGDGSRRRFADLMSTLRKRGVLDIEAARARVKSFEVFDTNKDGVVDMDELRVGLYDRFGVECTDRELKAAANDFDSNQNGILEVEEFAVGLIKRTIELGQDAKKAEAKALEASEARRKKDAATPLFSKLRNWISDKSDKNSDNDDDQKGGGRGGGGGGGGLGSMAPSPVLVPVPVRKRGDFDF